MSGNPEKSQCSPCWPSPYRSVKWVHTESPIPASCYEGIQKHHFCLQQQNLSKTNFGLHCPLILFPQSLLWGFMKIFYSYRICILYAFVGGRKQIPCRKGNHRLCPSQMCNPDWLFWTGWGAVGQTLQDIGSLQHMCCCKSVTHRGMGAL